MSYPKDITDPPASKPADGVPFSSSNSPTQDSLLLQPYSHILSVPGKNIRGKLIDGFNMWMGVAQEKIAAIEEIVQMLHNANLLVDEAKDYSILGIS